MFEKEQLKKIARLLVERGVYMITDEVYEHLVYDGMNHVSVASLGEKEKEMSITVNSLSKNIVVSY